MISLIGPIDALSLKKSGEMGRRRRLFRRYFHAECPPTSPMAFRPRMRQCRYVDWASGKVHFHATFSHAHYDYDGRRFCPNIGSLQICAYFAFAAQAGRLASAIYDADEFT